MLKTAKIDVIHLKILMCFVKTEQVNMLEY